jgi:hypothetical protein
MTQLLINVGNVANDGQGTPLRTAFQYINSNFTELYNDVGVASSISNGTSSVSVVSSGGNIATSVAGTSNVMVVSSTSVAITGDLSVSGNATLSGNILGDRIINGTTELDIQVANGNANLTIGGTSNVVVWAATGQYITGLNSASGNITGGNILTAGVVKTTAKTFSTLPAAANVGAGARSFITDANTATFGSQVTSGGSNAVPVWTNGTNWYVG